MKKIIRLTESELIRVIKRVINEQFDKNSASYYFNPQNDAPAYPYPGGMFFVKEGDSYRPWVGVRDSEYSDKILYKQSKYLVPKVEDLTAELNNNLNDITFPSGSKSFEANEIYKDFFGGGDKGVIVLKDGVPTKGVMELQSGLADINIKMGRTPVEFKSGNTIQYEVSFFLVEKPNLKRENYGKSYDLNFKTGSIDVALTV